MPQKEKLELWRELIRGNRSRVYGNLIGLLGCDEVITFSHNKDLKR